MKCELKIERFTREGIIMSTRIQLLLSADYNDLGESLQREIYYEYYQMMYGFIVYIVKDRSAAEDIIQEAFIKIIKSKPEFENEIKLKAWLKVVTKNTAINGSVGSTGNWEKGVRRITLFSSLPPTTANTWESIINSLTAGCPGIRSSISP